MINSPGKQKPYDDMGNMPPMFGEATMPGSLGWLALPRLLVLIALTLTFTPMIERCWLRDDPFLEGWFLRIDHLVLATLLGKLRMMVMRMVMLVLWL